jgi:hypothetical protein
VKFDKYLPLDLPPVDVPWATTEAGFRALLGNLDVVEVVPGHLRAACRVFGGIDHEVNFYFRPQTNGRFNEIQLYRYPTSQRRRGFNDWQEHLTQMFGPGTPYHSGLFVGDDLIRPTEWTVGSVRIVHDYYHHNVQTEKIVVTVDLRPRRSRRKTTSTGS